MSEAKASRPALSGESDRSQTPIDSLQVKRTSQLTGRYMESFHIFTSMGVLYRSFITLTRVNSESRSTKEFLPKCYKQSQMLFERWLGEGRDLPLVSVSFRCISVRR
jgi:hypothetical protein